MPWERLPTLWRMQKVFLVISTFSYFLWWMLIVIRTGWRRLHQSFGGIGLIHLPCWNNSFAGWTSSSNINWSSDRNFPALFTGYNFSWVIMTTLFYLITHDGIVLRADLSEWNSGSLYTTCRWNCDSNIGVSCHNGNLMGLFLMVYNLPLPTLVVMNRCCNFLNALFLSDITIADGKFISGQLLTRNNPSLWNRLYHFPANRQQNQTGCYG